MILYHYSVDSYSCGERLYNDHKGLRRFAEPYIFALEQGEACFWSVLYAAMALSRELCALGLRKHENYAKDAAEGIFEYIRQQEFSGSSVSRVGCVYYCQSPSEALAYLREDCLDRGDATLEQVKLLEVAVADSRVFRYDQQFFNRAQAALEGRCDLKEVIGLARAYFSLEQGDDPLPELLSDGENRILRELNIHQLYNETYQKGAAYDKTGTCTDD